MEQNLKLYDLEAFESYLIQAGYSKYTIPVYLRKVKTFLTHGDMNRVEDMDCSRLKAVIENYDGQLTLTSQTWMIKAAVYTYYGFCCGQMFHKRLSIKDFECTPAIDHEIGRFRKYLGLRCCEVAGLSLDDFDWIQGTLTIWNTKNHADRMLTLKEITGNSISEYLLHSRPLTSERTLFVRSG